MSSGLVLNTNINSLVAQNALSSSGTQLSQALEQLSTGLRINTAADDAAGYAIVNGMTSQINGLDQASENANDGVSLTQTASGALSEIVNDLQSMRDLAVESLNATNSSADRDDLDAQFQQLKADIDNVASTTQFNGVNLLDGSFQGATFQVGANAGQTITVSTVASAAASNLGQLYTAAATDPTAYTSTGAAGGTAVANGDTGTFTLTVGNQQYTTAAVTLTGDQQTDLTAIASAITEATGDAGVVATVDANGKGIDLSSTTAQTVTANYTPTTGAETLATFGLAATSNLTTASVAGTTTYAATGGAVTDDLKPPSTTYAATGAAASNDTIAGVTTYTATGALVSDDTLTDADTGTLSIEVEGNTYTTSTLPAGTFYGNAGNDASTIALALNSATDDGTTLNGAGYQVQAVGGALVVTGGSSPFTVASAAFNPATSDDSEDTIDLGFDGTYATPSTVDATGNVSVVIGGDTYTTATLPGLTGTTGTDLTTIKDGLNATAAFTNAGYTATVSSGALVITGPAGGTPFTVTSANYAAVTGSGTITLGMADTNASGTTTGDTGSVTLTIGSTTYTTSALTGLTGNTQNDLDTIVTALIHATGSDGNTLAQDGYTLSVKNDELVVGGGAAAFTASAAYTPAGAGNTLDLNMTSVAADGTLGAAEGAAAMTTLADADVQTVDSSNEVLIQIDAALQQLATTGADLGAYQDRFQAAVTGLQTDATNLSSARSQIQDTDYAQATSQLTQAQILQQAGTAMVAQANEIPQNVLTLINKLS